MEELTPSTSFTVKDSIVIDLLVAGFFYLMFGTAVSYNYGKKGFDSLVLLSLFPAISFTIRAFIRTAAITINRKGIWFSRQLVCTWPDFIAARIDQLEMRSGRWEDRNALAIEYYKGTEGDVYKKTIMLGNTQNKSGEEIITAIEYFYELYKKNAAIS